MKIYKGKVNKMHETNCTCQVQQQQQILPSEMYIYFELVQLKSWTRYKIATSVVHIVTSVVVVIKDLHGSYQCLHQFSFQNIYSHLFTYIVTYQHQSTNVTDVHTRTTWQLKDGANAFRIIMERTSNMYSFDV